MMIHSSDSIRSHHRGVDVGGLTLFFREAGDPDAPTVLLLHGFPSSSHMFRNLIPLLADRYHVADAPPPSEIAYTFAHLAEVVGRFTEKVGIDRYALYVFDYGAPVGFRMALRHPERITAIVSQNGNASSWGASTGRIARRERPPTRWGETRERLRPRAS